MTPYLFAPLPDQSPGHRSYLLQIAFSQFPCFNSMHIRVGQITIVDQRDLTFLATVGPLWTLSRHHLWTLTHARQSPHISIGLVGAVTTSRSKCKPSTDQHCWASTYVLSCLHPRATYCRSSSQRFATDIISSCLSIVKLPGQAPLFESVGSRPVT